MRAGWLLALLVLWPSAAGAYVRTATSAGAPMFWNRTVLEITAYEGNPPPPLEPGDLLRAARGAAATWSREQQPCTALEMRVASSPEDTAGVGLDGASRLVFRRDWCEQPGTEGQTCYDPFALAVTSVFARRGDGEILDADVELNGTFTWGDLVAAGAPEGDAQDLQNTLTHEFGHFIGMDHTCSLSGERPGLVDDQGHPVPSCARAPETVKATTMFAAVIPGDTDRRSLSQDDVRALCAVYPSLDPLLQADTTGCSLGRGRAAAPLALLLAGLTVVRLRRRGARPAPARRSSTDPSPPR